ncbi:Holliday junction branch migration protein RuvA [Ornithinimicrobium cryptoxanthini]|uniref:Holliday junction branch migration complex subunit RuvA n=1 Tax=Ornithinimicrobium cryptoxanthini TaxID=2934161 RepID=A0ABY4YMB4_9MICO|nr:Holliday junction branch migration protein RuvA [Ornithinimicrobium cryptoxanthini]USQ77874.1 Holliday junction branch migration protein RuvA [Ornithinimicrobium cryptoxanthini]
MIASVRGTVLHVGLDHVVVEVGGVGLQVRTTPATAAGCTTGREVTLATTLVVREESLTLYGFDSSEARGLFEQVQTVSGVGPRLAMAMLSVHPPEQVRQAIAGGDLVALTKVPGIGKKGAERIVLELKDKILAMGVEPSLGATPSSGAADATSNQVQAALVGLGWSAKQADDAVARVATSGAPTQVSEFLRAALRELGR